MAGKLAAGVFTPEGFADALHQFGKELDKPVVNAVRRGLHRARVRAGELFRLHGIGKTVFGAKRGKTTVRAYFKRSGVRHTGDVYVGGLWAKGLPALQETGGRTQPHEIKPTSGKALAFATPAGLQFAKSVQHPGGNLPAYPVLKESVTAEAPSIAADLDVQIKAFAAEKGIA